jgi:hypothetical protein
MTVRTDNCATGFSKILAEKSFLYKNIVRTGWLDRPDGRTSAASNFHNRLRASRPRGRSVQTAKLQHTISISDTRASGRLKSNRQLPYRCTSIRTTAVRRSDGEIQTAILALRRYASGRYTTSSRRMIDLPFLGTWKESVNRSRTDRRPYVLLKRPDGASWHRSFSIQCRCLDGRRTSSGQMMLD